MISLPESSGTWIRMLHRPHDLLVQPSITATTPFRLSDRVLLLGTVASPFLLLWFRSMYLWLGLIPLGALILHFWRRNFALFAHAVFWPMFFVGLLCLTWPLSFTAPLGAYLALYAAWPRLRGSTNWLVWGRFTPVAIKWTVPTVFISSGSLLAWVFLFRPDLSDLARMVPRRGPIVLIAIGVVFSVLNAIWEEFILKGIGWKCLEEVFRRGWAVNTGQAALFGAMHIGGFPRGWIGVLMASVYGFVLGVIRKESRGLLAPIATHIFADATIFLILYFISVGILSVQ
jgi:membrane protease YdiL (CAAX protease family)